MEPESGQRPRVWSGWSDAKLRRLARPVVIVGIPADLWVRLRRRADLTGQLLAEVALDAISEHLDRVGPL